MYNTTKNRKTQIKTAFAKEKAVLGLKSKRKGVISVYFLRLRRKQKEETKKQGQSLLLC